MGSHKTIDYFLLILIIPFSYCYVDSVTMNLIQRMETLETRDIEKTIVIERLTEQLGEQEKKIQVMELTIENLRQNLVKLSNPQQENMISVPKIDHNLDKLSEESNLLQFSSNDPDKVVLQAITTIFDTMSNKANESEVYVNNTHPKNVSSQANDSEFSKQVVRKAPLLLEGTANYKESEKEQLTRRKKRFVPNIAGPVAFHAVSDRSEVKHLGTDENIKFETILLNAGGGYHNQHGLFIAPKAGIYLFSTSVLSAGTVIHAQITKNGTPLAKAYGVGNTNSNAQGSVTVATQMNVGDEVWVKHIFPADGAFWGERFTSFTGVLISII